MAPPRTTGSPLQRVHGRSLYNQTSRFPSREIKVRSGAWPMSAPLEIWQGLGAGSPLSHFLPSADSSRVAEMDQPWEDIPILCIYIPILCLPTWCWQVSVLFRAAFPQRAKEARIRLQRTWEWVGSAKVCTRDQRDGSFFSFVFFPWRGKRFRDRRKAWLFNGHLEDCFH